MQSRRRLANPWYHLILHWRWCLANPRRDDVSLLRVSFNSTLESLPLQLCSQPLTGNSFAIDRLGNLPISCFLDLIPSSLFLETMTTLEMMFGYSTYHLILHWNHYLTSALSHWLATVSPLTILGTFLFPVLLILSLPCFFIKSHRRLSILLTSSCFLLL
jgi:hypothetical protein